MRRRIGAIPARSNDAGATSARPAMEAVLVRNDVNDARIESLFETDLDYLAGAAPVARFDF